jgi:hypothetical protein
MVGEIHLRNAQIPLDKIERVFLCLLCSVPVYYCKERTVPKRAGRRARYKAERYKKGGRDGGGGGERRDEAGMG